MIIRVEGLHEFGIFSTFLRQEEIPSWCHDRNDNKGSSSSSGPFVIPSHPINLRIRGRNVYSVYRLCNFNKIQHFLLFTKINNKSKDLKWIYTPVVIAIPKKGKEEKESVWLSHWKLGNHLESGDEVDVSVTSGSEVLELKKFGINFVWGEEEEEEEMKSSPRHNNTREVIGGDLSNCQFMSPQAFFLCHYFRYYNNPWRSQSWFHELFGDHATWEDFERWHLGKGRRIY